VSATLEQLKAALADRYAIERELGQGGMATVYLAEDLRHDRKVALKVLRPELAAILGGDRFLQEIKTTANLQHPHILPLHDSGEAGGSVFYVMPYVEGESLRDRISREKQLPVEDAVRIAREVAGALDYAHRHGVVHRDIKPENILLHDGSALVADFGIALAASRSDGGTRMTETGMSLGTPHYMSPEQAMGEREITARSDVYALGCVLYEMLTGDPPFTGSTAQAIVARVVTEQPRQITTQRRTVPPHVEAAVLTALEKLPADRFATAAEFIEALDGKGVRASHVTRATGAPAPAPWRRRPAAIGTGLTVAALAILAAWGWLRSPPAPPVIRYSLGFPANQGMQQGVLGVNLAISPDGRRFVYLGPGERGPQLWVRDRSQLDATPLPGTEGAVSPVFSPDGKHVAFAAGISFTLKVVSVDGGPPVTLAENSSGGGGGLAWGDDGWIYYDTGLGGFNRVRAKGGEPENVMPLDTAAAELGLAWPDVLPGGKQLLIRSRRSLNPDDFDIVVVDIPSGTRHVLTRGLVARYVEPGYLVFVRADGALVAARFEPGDSELRGSASPLLEGIMTKQFGSVDIAISREGTLLYVPGASAGSLGELAWVSRDGAVTPLQPTVNLTPSGNRGLALSPDGTRLALDVVGPQSVDLWVKQLPSGPFSRLTFEGRSNIRPTWTADGKSLVYISERNNTAVWRQRADGSSPPELLFAGPRQINEAQLSRDGRWLVYREIGDSSRDVYGIRLGQDTVPVPLLTSRFNEYAAALSPDGAWLAYVSNESGTPEVYVRPFPRTSEARYQVSRAGGEAPRWGRQGRELFYESGAREMMVVSVKLNPSFVAEEPRRLFALGTGLANSSVVPYYDLAPDDSRFIMLRLGGGEQSAGGGQLVVVEHWLQEMRAKVEEGQR
jgi:Tol biopolymer transport system component